mmetsp:Transcript_35955/g.84218  ORF Transcript_35955/g.84218 Transcript_35955/m.84218 type:complete len:704 (+) Transcript_35955:58-2169(+)
MTEVETPNPTDSVEMEAKPVETDPDSSTTGADSAGSTADTLTETSAPAPTAAVAGGGAAGIGVAAELSVPHSLGHREHLRDQFEFTWRHRLEPAHRLVDQLLACLRSRAILERQYAASIMQLSQEVNLDGRSGSVHEAMDAAMVNFRSRGEQSMELADEIEEDIVVTLETTIAQHREVAKQILADMQRISRFCQEALLAHEKAARQYGSECAEAELVANEFLHGASLRPVDRTKVAMRGVVTSKRARMAEHEYYQSIEQANRAQSMYDQHMPVILEALREMDEKRERCIRDCLMKLCVYEASWLRNLQYDLEAAMKTSEIADADADVKQVYEQHASDKQAVKPAPELVPRGYWEIPKLRGPPPNPKATRVRLEGEVMVSQQVEVMQPLLRRILTEKPLTKVDEVKIEVEPLQYGLVDLCRRAAFCRAMQTEVMTAAPEGVRDLDSAPSLCITQEALEIVAQLIKAALDGCNQPPGDAWNGKHLIQISRLFHAESESGKTVSLLSLVYSHPLWSRVTFWEEVLLIAVCEAFGIEAKLRRTMSPGFQFQQVTMTTFLKSFMQYMLSFGIRPEQARHSVQQSLRKHVPLLGPAAEVYSAQLLATLPPSSATTPTGGRSPATPSAHPPAEGFGQDHSCAVDEASKDAEAAVASRPEADKGSETAAEEGAAPASTTSAAAEEDGSTGEASTDLAGLGVTQPSLADVFT